MAEFNNKEFSTKQEKMVASQLGGYPVGLSGAGPANPGDVRTYEWLVECKTHTTPGKPIFFDIDVWKKIENEAMGVHRKPVLVVDDGSQSASSTWCLCKSFNINLSGAISVDLPVKIRKNISCKHDKLLAGLKAISKSKIHENTFYSNSIMVYEVNWGSEDVVIMPLSTFKELFEK